MEFTEFTPETRWMNEIKSSMKLEVPKIHSSFILFPNLKFYLFYKGFFVHFVISMNGNIY